MRLKTKLVFAITGLVFVVVLVFSWLYFSQLLQQHIDQSYNATDIVAHQLLFATRQQIDPNDPVALRTAVASALRNDAALNALLNSVISYSPTVFDISIADQNGRVYLSTDPILQDQFVPQRVAYASLRKASLVQILEVVFGPPRVYDVSLSLERNNQPFVTVQIGIRTTFLSHAFRPWFFEAASLIGFAVVITLLVSAMVANLAFKPIELISKRLDLLTAEVQSQENDPVVELENPDGDDTVLQVSHKIERLGRRMKNVEEVFSSLKQK